MGTRASSSSRSHSPGSSISSTSTNVSTESSTSAYDDSSVEAGAPAGSFDLGLTKAAAIRDASAHNAVSTEPAAVTATTDDVQAQPAHPAKSSRPATPRPVLLLIRNAAFVLVGGGLFSTIYGGLKLMPPFDPALDAQRGAHIGVMVSGVVEMVIGLVVGMSTLNDPRSPTPPSHPPSHPA